MTPILVLVTILCYFLMLFTVSYITGRKSDNQGFFIGNRKSPWYIVAFAMIGASLSGVTFVSVPGMVGVNNFAYLQMVLGFIVGQLIIAYVLTPLYYRMEGCPIGQFYTWEWAGYNNDGVSTFYVHDAKTGERTGETTVKPGFNDRAKAGSAQPKVTFGWNNNLNYKKWSMNLFFQGIAGNKILNSTRARLLNVIGNAGNRNLLKDASKTEKVTDYNSHMLSDRYLEKGDYLRLATLSLSYNVGNIGDWINNVRIYATCNNVFTITGYKGIDPEVYLGGLTPGIDNRQTYPRTRTYMLGVNINF